MIWHSQKKRPELGWRPGADGGRPWQGRRWTTLQGRRTTTLARTADGERYRLHDDSAGRRTADDGLQKRLCGTRKKSLAGGDGGRLWWGQRMTDARRLCVALAKRAWRRPRRGPRTTLTGTADDGIQTTLALAQRAGGRGRLRTMLL